MVQTQNQVAADAAGAQAPRLATEAGGKGRIIFLNALPLNALPRLHVRLDVTPVDITELGHRLYQWLSEGYELVHYIRHEATLRALRSALHVPLPPEPNAGLYQYTLGDILIVATLRNPMRGQEQTQVRPEDLEVWIVTLAL